MKVQIGPYPKRDGSERVERVQIDPHDVVSLDHTLALVILPTLRQFREERNGYPFSLVDISHHATMTWGSPEFKKAENRAHAKAQREYGKAIDKMIWAFEQIVDDCTLMEPALPEKRTKAAMTRWHRAYGAYHKRVDEGLELFAKYYRSLWI